MKFFLGFKIPQLINKNDNIYIYVSTNKLWMEKRTKRVIKHIVRRSTDQQTKCENEKFLNTGDEKTVWLIEQLRYFTNDMAGECSVHLCTVHFWGISLVLQIFLRGRYLLTCTKQRDFNVNVLF